MKKIIIYNKEYFADKIIKQDNNIKLINAKKEIDNVLEEVGNLLFPNISNMGEFMLEEGQDWDISEEDEMHNRINELELFILSQEGLI